MTLRAGLLLLLMLTVTGCGDGLGWSSDHARFVSPEGTPVDVDDAAWNEHGALFAVDAETGAAARQYVIDHRKDEGLRIPRIRDGERLLLRLAGCRDVEIPVPPPAEPLVVSYGYPVRLRLETGGELPPAPYEIRLELAWRGPGDAPDALLADSVAPAAPAGWLESRRGSFYRSKIVVGGGEQETSFCVSVPGPYRVTWMLFHVSGTPGNTTAVGFGSPGQGGRIVVEDRPEEQVFVLRLDPRRLAEAVGSLAR